MYCSQCGCENPDAASFCKSCGKPVSRRVAPAASGGYPGQPSVNAGAHPVAAYSTSAGTIGGGRAHGGMGAKLIGAILVAVVAIVVAVIVAGGLGSGEGRPTSGQLAQDLSSSYSRLFSSGLSDSAITTVCNDMIDMMPGEAVDAALEKAGITDRSNISSLMSGYLSSSSISSVASYLDKLSVDCSLFVGDEISSSELSSINSDFQDAGVNLRATSGNELGINMSVTALEDMQDLSKGESKSQTVESTGLLAINIDGKWYLWGDSML